MKAGKKHKVHEPCNRITARTILAHLIAVSIDAPSMCVPAQDWCQAKGLTELRKIPAVASDPDGALVTSEHVTDKGKALLENNIRLFQAELKSEVS